MSIIFEALKKASPKVTTDNYIETANRISKSEEQSCRPKSASLLLKFVIPLSLTLAIVLTAFLSLSLIFKYIIPLTEETGSGVPPALVASKSNLTAEGYVPPQTPDSSFGFFKQKASNPKIALNGIVYGIGRPVVIVDNKILEEGSMIKGVRVVKIYKDRVDFLNQASGEAFTLKVY